jgi:hypothetical protein
MVTASRRGADHHVAHLAGAAIEEARNNSILATIPFIFVPRVDAQATAVVLALANHL